MISFRISWFDLLAVQGLSSVFSSTTVQKHQFFNAQPSLGFTDSSVSKNLSAMQETPIRFLGQEDPLEKRKAIHSSILAWRISWREEPGGLQSMPLQRVGQDGSTNTYFLTQSNFSKIDDLTELLREIRAESTVDTP